MWFLLLVLLPSALATITFPAPETPSRPPICPGDDLPTCLQGIPDAFPCEDGSLPECPDPLAISLRAFAPEASWCHK